MLKIGLIVFFGFVQMGQPQISEDSIDLKDILREEQVENRLLEQEVSLMKDHVKEVRNTVWFSLGGVVGLVLIFAGANWLTQNNLFKNEKKRIVQEFDNKLIELENKYNKELSEEVTKLKEMISDKISNLDKFTRSKTEDLALTLSDVSRYQSRISYRNGEFEASLKHLVQSMLSQAIHDVEYSTIENDLDVFEEVLNNAESLTVDGKDTLIEALDFINEKTRKEFDEKSQELISKINSIS
ncbi:hypothetical protein [Gracilimonas sp.]|uniref:hypothetical protein n=1 Tax=Gracilimonas sp. TaxID=1974203 RepID=UPI0032EF10D1